METKPSATGQPNGDESACTITPVNTPADLHDIVALFHEYVASLKIDLSFQDFATEVSSLPGKYSPPTGCLLLARSRTTGQAIGCVALRPLEPKVCEMKRLYVSPLGRGAGLGKALALRALEQARQLGYERARLDTLANMGSARALYGKLGFVEVEPYYNSPMKDTKFLELTLGLRDKDETGASMM
ncbi:GCN5-like N-acetyltransferase [Truncatella angustata]|uniref:GCN5-like N-acetyltransferase n=1 Tax=Truncatella angustata TaxID=152316 RepID=A0A9P8RMQ4_9PEZI|nr:GCN5-like N-acetyltransferase [Truncatella angustata]KAH6646260.1 GCN5-like N-acetyltransferase [Truncatella angustata]KAH8203934.1 hypothetical protein TruAng_001876 [Truncatella angustata]